MPCYTSEDGNITICRPSVEQWKVVINRCPTCERRTKKLLLVYGYYGGRLTCLACGESWTDGEMDERPFERGWRKKSIEHAKAMLAALAARSPELKWPKGMVVR